MKRIQLITCVICVLALIGTTSQAPAQIPQTLSYQGVLTDGAGGAVPDGSYNITFNLYAVASGGTAIWTETQSVQVDGGIFSVILGAQTPLTSAFDQPYWLGVSVDGGQEFSPRRELTSAAYSLNTRSIASGQAVTSLNALTDDVILAAGTNVSITTSTDSIIISSSGGGASLDWSLTGNAGTTPGTNFVGTTDDQALEFHVNNTRALLIQPDFLSPNITAGHSANTISATVSGAVIAGGGTAAFPNLVTDRYCVVGGGTGNQAGNGDALVHDTPHATVAGGQFNLASEAFATVSGGEENQATQYASTVMGGRLNTASGMYSAVVGFRGKIGGLHNGTFLFSDFNNFDFNSAAGNEFAVRATGGVRLVTGIDGAGTPIAGATLAAGSGTWGSLSDRDAKENFEPIDGDDVLERVAQLEITTWNYKAQDSATRHIGPMAQDFYAAFELGGDDKRITTVDADGVSLAAIQALNRKLNQALKKKDAKISDLERRIERLESLVLQVSRAETESAE